MESFFARLQSRLFGRTVVQAAFAAVAGRLVGTDSIG
jgi:hypothetical protein